MVIIMFLFKRDVFQENAMTIKNNNTFFRYLKIHYLMKIKKSTIKF